MEEIVEQYKNALKWKNQMFIFMTVLFALAAASTALGFVIRELLAMFAVFGVMMAALGIFISVVAANTFNKMDKLVKEYLSNMGKSEEEIISILGDSK